MEHVTIKKMTCARIPTTEGVFELCLYHNNQDNKEHLALVMGEVANRPGVLVRIHSECLTGDVLGSLRCDCGPQLRRAMELIAAEGTGILLYLRQEGRGIGLLDKLRAYNLQDEGYDTVEANLLLGHQADARDYTVAALILQDLGVGSVQLLTNNPAKITSLEKSGIVVTERVPLETAVTVENEAYLAAKVNRMRHLLKLDSLAFNGNGRIHPEIKAGKWDDSNTHLAISRPSVTLSYAQSLDGSITLKRGQPTALSGAEAMQMTHRLRAEHDAILVGIGTVLADDPRLTVRLVHGPQPQPIVLDSQLRFPTTAVLLQHPNPPWIVTTKNALSDREKMLQIAGARIVRVEENEAGQVALRPLLHSLVQWGIRRLMVEGGGSVISSFLQEGLVDKLAITVSPRLMGGFHAVQPLFERLTLREIRYQQVGRDMMVFAELA